MVALFLLAITGCSTGPQLSPEELAAETARRRKAKAVERLRELEPKVCQDPSSPTCKRVTKILLEADMAD